MPLGHSCYSRPVHWAATPVEGFYLSDDERGSDVPVRRSFGLVRVYPACGLFRFAPLSAKP